MNKSSVIEYNGKKYVWYTPTKQANQMVDRKLEKENQQIVSDLGITSKNLVFFEDGMKINEYIEGDSLNHLDEFDYSKIANMLKILHSSKQKSRKDYCPFEKVLNYIEETKALNIELDDKFYELYNEVLKQENFLKSIPLSLCHNDFQKSNIIKTPEDSYFMIDFEFMMNNDPLFDVAAFGNDDVNEGFLLLNEYLDYNITKKELKRFSYWRILLSLQWYLVALIKDQHGEGKVHGYDFKMVAKHFLENANDAKSLLSKYLPLY